jgi:hypothetical protein
VTYTATATDIVDGPIVPTCAPASGSTFVIGTTTVTCSATDAHGNAASRTFTVTVNPAGGDVTPPVLKVPENITAEATSPAGATVTYKVTATDNKPGPITIACVPPSGSTFGFGTTTVTCTARDVAGNTSTKSFIVKVRDTTRPVINAPTLIVKSATSPAGAVVTFAATATDNIDGPIPVTCTPPSGSVFAIGTRTVTCHATDAHGNTRTATITVVVLGAREQIVVLGANVLGAGLPSSLRNTLTGQLTNAFNRLPANPTSACSSMNSFISAVTAATTPLGPISATRSASWIADANRIKAVIPCGI